MRLADQSNESSTNPTLVFSIVLLGSALFVVRPLASQFQFYSPDAALAGLLAVMLAMVVGVWNILSPQKFTAPRGLRYALVIWFGVLIWGAARSENMGQGVPQAVDAAICALLLLCGYYIGRREPQLLNLFARVIVAMVVVEAFAAIWQVQIDLPRLRKDILHGTEQLPEALQGKIGLDRFYGDNAFGTFDHPNSFAGYLLVGIWLLIGLSWNLIRERRRWIAVAAPLAVMLVALVLTSSKGAICACALGAWFFAVQRLSMNDPKRARLLRWLTIAGSVSLLAILALGIAGAGIAERLGASMHVRFEYWKSALRMFADHPLGGVGLGAFADYYLHYKTPAGWETKDAHNDYIQFLAELGIIGPLIYGLIWWLILKGNGASRRSADATIVGKPMSFGTTEIAAIIGGVGAFLLMYYCFPIFNRSDISAIFAGKITGDTIVGALETIFIPVLFVFMFRSLRSDDPRKAAGQSQALFHGFRAAAGVILMHELVDFDFKAQGVMTALFFLGGMFLGQRAAEAGEEGQGTGARAFAWQLALPIVAVLLIPLAVFMPLYSGTARVEAEALESELSKDDSRELINDLLRARKEASAYAPFDADALIDLALARARYPELPGRDWEEKNILPLLKQAEEMRPAAANPKVVLGSYYFRRGIQERRAHNEPAAKENFDLALTQFGRASYRYPLHPGLSLMEGDAWLMSHDVKRAATSYWYALDVDMRISDPNVCLSSMFIDPRPGVFSRHGMELEVFQQISEILKGRVPAKLSEADLPGLLLRRAVACVFLIRDNHNRSVPDKNYIATLTAELHFSLRELRRLSYYAPDGAHAELLCALSFQIERMDDVARLYASGYRTKHTSRDISEQERVAWLDAIRDQKTSIASGNPGTPPDVFNWLLEQFGPPQR